jgi:hypothetical protein
LRKGIGIAEVALCIEKVEIHINVEAAGVRICMEKTMWQKCAIEPSVVGLDAAGLKE